MAVLKVVRRGKAALLLLGLLAAVALTGPLYADFATPFVEINNKVGDRSEAHGYVVALGDELTHFIVIVSTDAGEYVVIPARSEKDVVKPEVLGRPAIVKAEVVKRTVDDNGRVQVELKIHSVAPRPERVETTRLGPESADRAKSIASKYVAKKHPDLDVTHKAPIAQYAAENRSTMAGGGPFWMVTYAVPAPRDENGKIVGVRPYHSFTVYLDLAGNVVNEAMHTP